jgi:hypothetical protein
MRRSWMRRYKKRWKVERLFAWMHNFRRLVNRWEYHIDNFLGMVHPRMAPNAPQTRRLSYVRPCFTSLYGCLFALNTRLR